MKNYTTYLLLFVSVYFSFSVFAQKKYENNKTIYTYTLFKGKGDANYANGNYLKAISYYTYCINTIDNSDREYLLRLIQNSKNLFKLREEATTAFIQKDYQTAKNICQKILKINPDITTKKLLEGIESVINTKHDSFLENFIKKGDERLMEGKFEEARAFYRVITQSNDDYKKAYVKIQLKKIEENIAILPPDCKPQFDNFVKLANQQYGESQFKKSVKNYTQAKNLQCNVNTRWIDDAIFYCNRSIYLLQLIGDLENNNDESNINRVLDAYQKLTFKYAPRSQGLKKDFYEYCKRRFLKNTCGGKSAEYSSKMKSLDEKLFITDGIKSLLDTCNKQPNNNKDTTVIVKDCKEQFKQLERIKTEIKESVLNIESGNYTLAEQRLKDADKKIITLDCISKKDATELPLRISTLLDEITKKNSQKLCREKSQKSLLQADSLFTNGRCKGSFEILKDITVNCLSKTDSIRYNTLSTRVRCCINDTLFIQHMKLNQAKYLDSTRLSYAIRERTDVCYYIKEAVKFTCTKEDSLKLESQYRDCRCKNFKENCLEIPLAVTQVNHCDTTAKFRVRFEFFIGGSLGTFKPIYPLAVSTDDGYNTSFELGKRFGVRINLMSYKKILDLRVGINSESFYYTVKDSKLTFPSTISSMSVLNGNIDFKFHTLPTCPSKIRYFVAPGVIVSRYNTSTPNIPFLEDYTNRTFNDKIYGGFSVALGLEKTKGSGKYGYSIELFYSQLGTLYSKDANEFLKPWESTTAQINFVGLNIGAFIF